MIERLRLLEAQGTVETMEPPDETSNAYKMYKDFVVPPLPPAYAHLDLPSYWIIHMFAKKQKKRSHKKSSDELMPFQQLAQAIANSYKAIDSTTKAWLDELSGKLLDYNKAMREDLGKYLKEHGHSEEEEKKKKAAAKASAKAEDQERKPSALPSPHPSSHITPAVSRAAVEERIRYIQCLHAAELSLEVQALRNRASSGPSPGLQRRDMYSSLGPGFNERYADSPRGISSLYPGFGNPALYGSMGQWPPVAPSQSLPRRDNLSPGTQMAVETQYQSLLHSQSPKRPGEEAPASSRDTKRTRTSSLEADQNELRARFSVESGRAGMLRDSMMTSSIALPFPTASRAPGGLASLRGVLGSYPPRRSSFESGAGSRRPESRAERPDELMLGYQLGLQAAARAQGGGSTSRFHGFTDSDVSARLQALQHRVSPAVTREGVDAYARSEFGLSYSEIMSTLNEMNRNRESRR